MTRPIPALSLFMLLAASLAHAAPGPSDGLLYQPHVPRCGHAVTVAWQAPPEAVSYDVQVRKDGAWTNWLMGTKETSALFQTEPGKSYAFRMRAHGKGFTPAFSEAVAATAIEGAVAVLSPTPGRHIERDGSVLLLANGVEDACDIAAVTWRLDGKDLVTLTQPPYRHALPAPAAGRHEIQAVARLKDGRESASRPVSLRVLADPTPCPTCPPPTVTVITPENEQDQPPPKSHRVKPVKPDGSAQTLRVYYAEATPEPPATRHGYMPDLYEVVTSDGFPPNHLTLRLEGAALDDAHLRAALLYHYDEAARAWKPLKDTRLDEERMVLSAPIDEQGLYCVSIPDDWVPPEASIQWLFPADGATLTGKTTFLTAATGELPLHTSYGLERTDLPFGGRFPAARAGMGFWDVTSTIDPHGDGRDAFMGDLTPRYRTDDRELPLDLSRLASGEYRLIAMLDDDAGSVVSALRSFHVESDVKPPTVSFAAARATTADGVVTFHLSGTARKGTFPVQAVLLLANGDPTERMLFETLEAEENRWQTAASYMPDGPAEWTAIAVDRMGNVSEPARTAVTLPLQIVRATVPDPAEARVGHALQYDTWPAGGAQRNATRIRYDVSWNNGKTWKTVRDFSPEPGFTWTPTTPGTYLVRITVKNGAETVTKTKGPLTVRR